LSRLPKHLAVLSQDALEGLCLDCGLCCHPAVTIIDGINAVIPELACKHLVSTDGESHCSVYNTRHEVAKAWCLPLADAIDKGIFPNLCPYVKDMPGYLGTTVLDDATYAQVKPLLQKAVAEAEQPAWATPDMIRSFVGSDK
jgi:uncharacterized cysteine cluster protein YcgN (CxxCxxCC family)